MYDKNKRRRIFYIDKIFQKKLLFLFLGINVIIVIANIVFYFTHLKGKLEENMFRSHIAISNLNEILAGDVIYFNILLAVGSLLLVLIFYTVVRLRLNSFFGKIKKAVQTLQARTKEEPLRLKIPREFYEIDRVMGEFIQYTDKKLAEEDSRLSTMKLLYPTSLSLDDSGPA